MSRQREERPPDGWVWPLRISQVKAALSDAEAPDPSAIVRDHSADSMLLSIRWSPAATDQLHGYRTHGIYGLIGSSWGSGEETVTLHIGTVRTAERELAEQACVEDVLPDIATWLRSAGVERQGWRLLRHEKTWAWVGGAAIITKSI